MRRARDHRGLHMQPMRFKEVPQLDHDPSTDWMEYRMVIIALIAAIATLLVHG